MQEFPFVLRGGYYLFLVWEFECFVFFFGVSSLFFPGYLVWFQGEGGNGYGQQSVPGHCALNSGKDLQEGGTDYS